MTFFLTLLIFIFIIGFLIFSHELGHFIAAKSAGLLVEEFALGFPPNIFSKKIGETKYSINLIPFGGYVKIYGEDPDEDSTKNERSFYCQKPIVKAKVLIAGVFANILVAAFIFYIVLSFSGFKWNVFLPFDYNFIFGKQSQVPLIVTVLENSPAEESGLKEGEMVLSVNGLSVSTREDFVKYVNIDKEKVVLALRDVRSKEEREVEIIPKEEDGTYFIGVLLSNVTEIKYESFNKVFSGFLHAVNMTHLSFYSLAKLTYTSIGEKTVEPFRDSTAGVVGIFAITHIVMKEGIIELLNMAALISIGLAVVNILPIPALDGGRLVFVIYEAVSRRKTSPNFERNLNLAGFAFLILLIITITYNDIIRFGGLIKGMF
ncbi:MAG: M50 family metallopeptidase [Candidatus Pacebacteria bacterium]|nr:M50 family metallopeptidase [Candidatus Paceibacterota bacterium]MDD3072112.1 M50 family metallopeptidase [Candidatus Paceibacterota bacterium]MDD3728823.1 M50 family metallopeptidase [Candidatus Paceibacterota bacterium]MDD4201318.1 M50 family metallopeptidase [Candidatus Paceibacterota bacterium]MDD4466990.1 M50 family metallopeptidase [Candidatus Paceibacterota bacterium]